jgi:hypothetical protein
MRTLDRQHPRGEPRANFEITEVTNISLYVVTTVEAITPVN